MKLVILMFVFNIKCSHNLYRANDTLDSVNSVIEKIPFKENGIQEEMMLRDSKRVARDSDTDELISHLKHYRKHVLASEIRKGRHARRDRDKQAQRPKKKTEQIISSNDIRKKSNKNNTNKKSKSGMKNFMVPSDFKIKYERFIFPCYTTDMECFRRQYRSIRDHALLGNAKLGIPPYEDYIFRYSEKTCIRLSGWEESELAMISMDSRSKNINLAFDLPIRIRQVKGTVKPCKPPDKEFITDIKKNSPLRRFAGNATVFVSYPFNLKRSNGNTYMYLQDEDIDVTFDIPDWSHMKGRRGAEAKVYEWSEWAYDVVQHVDAAQNFVMPYTNQLRTLLQKIPISRAE